MSKELDAVRGNPLADVFTDGEAVVEGSATKLPLTGKKALKGNYVVGKYLGLKTITPKDGSKPFTIGTVAVLETNMEGDTGPVVAGEVCSFGVSGLLAWGLQKVAAGRIVAIRFDGKGPGVDSEGEVREMNRFTVRDVTARYAALGVN